MAAADNALSLSAGDTFAFSWVIDFIGRRFQLFHANRRFPVRDRGGRAMAKKIAAAARLRKPRGTTIGSAGMHPVFGPIADPAPDSIGGGWGGWGGGWGGWGGGGGWHGGPVADPGPDFGGWRGTILGSIDLSVLESAAVKQLAEFRVRRINVEIRALEERVAIMKEEFELVSRFAEKLQIDKTKIPLPGGGAVDPAPELRPIDFLRYLYDLRTASIRRTIDLLKTSVKAIEAAR